MSVCTRDRIVDAGSDLFQQLGFANVGLDQVLKKVGLTKTTFYNHFSSKEELIQAAIQRRDDRVVERLQMQVRLRDEGSPKARLLAVFDAFHEIFSADDDARCLSLSAALGFPNPQDPTHQVALQRRDLLRDYLRQLTDETGVNNPEQFAERLAMLVDAALVGWHTTHDPDSVLVAKQMAERLIDSDE